jgi:hypothetical protein
MVFFFLTILWCRQFGDFPQEVLPKFGYGKNTIFSPKKNPFILGLPTGTCCRNMAICFWKSGELGPIFFTQILCVYQNHIFLVKKMQKFIALSNPTNQLSSYEPHCFNYM